MSPVLLAVLLVASAAARGGEVIGAVGTHLVAPGESLIEIARDHDVGFNEIAEANPGLDPFVPTVGAAVVVPTSWILPAALRPGAVVVNLSEMRLYVAGAGPASPITFPIGVGMEGSATPLGVLTVVEKIVDPTWYPTRAIREEDASLPAAVPPGPDNPLGTHALRLSRRTILIHGTDRPFGVGRRVSHGCLRLYPEDIPQLFALVHVGTPVVIVREPVKVGFRRGRVLVEIHKDGAAARSLKNAVRLLREWGVLRRVDPARLAREARARSGVPVDVTAEGS